MDNTEYFGKTCLKIHLGFEILSLIPIFALMIICINLLNSQQMSKYYKNSNNIIDSECEYTDETSGNGIYHTYFDFIIVSWIIIIFHLLRYYIGIKYFDKLKDRSNAIAKQCTYAWQQY